MSAARAIASQIDPVFAGLKTAGFRNIERFAGTLGVSPVEYADLLRRNGLKSVASHDQLGAQTWEQTLDQAKALGQTFVGSGGYGAPGFATLESTLQTAANLDRLGKAAKAKGLTFYVHSHSVEFSTKFPYDLKKTGQPQPTSVWEIVAANTDPKNVSFEIDIHWARRGIGLDRFDDLLDILRRYRSRVSLLHIKDTAANGSIADLGAGTTNWPALYAAAGPQIRYYIWEYDAAPDPIRSAGIAHRYLRCG
jgi:sugar phosphate isomerase/epimerase